MEPVGHRLNPSLGGTAVSTHLQLTTAHVMRWEESAETVAPPLSYHKVNPGYSRSLIACTCWKQLMPSHGNRQFQEVEFSGATPQLITHTVTRFCSRSPTPTRV